MDDRGTLKKLQIQAYEKPNYKKPVVDTFEAFLNPNEITLSYEIEYDAAQGSGTTASRMNFKKLKPGDMTLAFFLDGTGANGRNIDVQQQIEKFQNVTGYSGKIHRTRYLLVAWGRIQIRRCVLKSASIAYKLFQPNGVPLRAVITAVFTDNSDDQTRISMARDESSDLTHARVVKAGDQLPALCHQIYGDARYYLEVARANQLNHFRQLEPGAKIFFPPLEK